MQPSCSLSLSVCFCLRIGVGDHGLEKRSSRLLFFSIDDSHLPFLRGAVKKKKKEQPPFRCPIVFVLLQSPYR